MNQNFDPTTLLTWPARLSDIVRGLSFEWAQLSLRLLVGVSVFCIVYEWKYDKCVGMHLFLGLSIGRCSLRMDYLVIFLIYLSSSQLWVASGLSSFIFPLIWQTYFRYLSSSNWRVAGYGLWGKIFPKRALSAFEGSVVSLSPLQLSFLYQIRTNSFDATHE